DALEALRPGALKKIVEDAVDQYRDDDIEDLLEQAETSANDALNEAWDERVTPIENSVEEIREKAVAIAATYEKRLAQLNTELQKELKPYKRRLERLEKQAKETIDEVIEETEAELPD